MTKIELDLKKHLDFINSQLINNQVSKTKKETITLARSITEDHLDRIKKYKGIKNFAKATPGYRGLLGWVTNNGGMLINVTVRDQAKQIIKKINPNARLSVSNNSNTITHELLHKMEHSTYKSMLLNHANQFIKQNKTNQATLSRIDIDNKINLQQMMWKEMLNEHNTHTIAPSVILKLDGNHNITREPIENPNKNFQKAMGYGDFMPYFHEVVFSKIVKDKGSIDNANQFISQAIHSGSEPEIKELFEQYMNFSIDDVIEWWKVVKHNDKGARQIIKKFGK